ncbi:RNase A-like domain-containing protein [Streptomyces sp. ZAF1911]|uniref:RNase A-like domain-containing protein n=1 Tax=Streptomyces sp. ZAF1911 TaxID=2944129 RepID=UPI003FD353C1
MLTRTATYPDRETAQWATQEVITRNEQAIHRRLAQGTRLRIPLEAAWRSRPDLPVGATPDVHEAQRLRAPLRRAGPGDQRLPRPAHR